MYHGGLLGQGLAGIDPSAGFCTLCYSSSCFHVQQSAQLCNQQSAQLWYSSTALGPNVLVDFDRPKPFPTTSTSDTIGKMLALYDRSSRQAKLELEGKTNPVPIPHYQILLLLED